MGAHGKGTRNESGEKLAHFLSEAVLYSTNTTFQKSIRHRMACICIRKAKIQSN